MNMLSHPLQQRSTVLKSFSTVTKDYLPGEFAISSISQIRAVCCDAAQAFLVFQKKTAQEKAHFLEKIAEEIMGLGDELIQRAMLESGLPQERLIGERGRTIHQFKLFAELLREGSWVDAVIDSALPQRKPMPRPDIRKMLAPIGPVLVFGASNFPLAFSTAGGDTASALAAGNPVIVKAHETHLGTHELLAKAIGKAAKKTKMPAGVFGYINSSSLAEIQYLIKQESIKAIGFTGSYKAGMAIFNVATHQRKTPIPVFAEMGSVNPVVLLPEKLKLDPEGQAAQLAASITLGVGQFCTNPGLIFLIKDEAADKFVSALSAQIAHTPAGTMLNKGICKNFYQGIHDLRQEAGISVLARVNEAQYDYKGAPTLLLTDAAHFMINDKLQEEIFGPSALLVMCYSKQELLLSLQKLKGQLTASILGHEADAELSAQCVDILVQKVGRILFKGVPTGVEVCHAMVHGGPYPATTQAASTSVGTEAIKRFTRPICFQDCPPALLPAALQNRNPLKIFRKINGQISRDPIAD